MARRISSSLPDAHGPTAAPLGVTDCVGAAGFLPRHGLRLGVQGAPLVKTLRGAPHEDPFAAGSTMMRRVPARLHSKHTRPHRQPGTHRHSQQPGWAARPRQREAADARRPDSFRCAVSGLLPTSLPLALALTQTGLASGLLAPPGRPRLPRAPTPTPYANACLFGPPAPQTNPGL